MFKRLGMFDRSLGMFQPLGKFAAAFSPIALFASGEQGTWYDPSDWTTLFQDSAGTLPVTAVEQPVGKILDKSGNGNHASQSTTTSRPILRNLYNMLTYTEQFDNAVWVPTNLLEFGSGSVANATTSPDGTQTADLLVPNNTSGFHQMMYNVGINYVAGNSYTVKIYVQSAGYTTFTFVSGNNAIFPSSSVLTISNGTHVGDGWYLHSYTATAIASGSANIYFRIGGASPYAGNGTSGIYIWGASLVPANEASLPYQRVVTNTPGTGVYDSDVTKFPVYLAFNGVESCLITGNINFSATDKMSVFAGVRKLSDAALGVVTELSAATSTNNGTFCIFAPGSILSDRYGWRSKGTIAAEPTATSSVYVAPSTVIYTGLGNITGDSAILRLNSTQISVVTTDQGSGNFGNYPLYVGRRGGTELPFNGRMYSLIVRGALTSSPQLEQTEQWVAAKTGVTL